MNGRLFSFIGSYAANDDPLVRVANNIALIVASNQPFYPLYLYWMVSGDIAPAFLTFLSTPFFLAVPAIARKQSLIGRALVPVAGTANTVLCAKIFGVESGVEVFLFPCLILAIMLFRPGERIVSLVIAGAIFGVFIFLHGSYGAPTAAYSTDEYASLLRLNAISAACLAAVIAYMFSNNLAAAEQSIASKESYDRR
jgi:hypothetical protein